MSKAKKILSSFAAAYIYLPLVALAAGSEPGRLVPKCAGKNGSEGPCRYDDLILLGQNFLLWAIYLVALSAVVAIAYAGFLYLSSGGDSGKISKAHAIFGKVIWGIVITLAAFLIVESVLKWLGVGSEWSLLS